MNGEKALGLVPPRPNLGPEPWRETALMPRLPLAMAAAVVVLLAAWYWRRRGLFRARRAGPTAGDAATADRGPRERLLDLSETLRDALTTELGLSFRARTTEELSGDEQLAQLLGEEGFRDLLQFLDRIDRVKFARERPADQDEELGRDLMAWEPRITSITARIRSRPKNRPRLETDREKRPA